MAICGGVNCMLTPDMFISLSKARMISPTGLCHTFSDKADGYTRGEGCGILILKRLADAIRDGDNIRAIVYTGTNQDGHAVSPMTAPSGEQQKKLLHSVYDKFLIDVSQVDYIEAHGTGTPAGDPVEVNALGSFFKEKGPPRERHIGSVKTNIGHTESAAGVLSLIKVLLMMEHNTIVPSLHCEVVNPQIDLSGHRFVIPKNVVPWDRPHKVAACNSFGFGGSNSHAVLRSYTAHHSGQTSQKRERSIVCFSGKTQKALKSSLEDFYNDEEVYLLNVHDVSHTSTVRRDHYPFRATFIVEDMDDLMTAVGEQLVHDNWAPPVPPWLNVVFVFCGMGTAWDGMCRQLLDGYQVFRDTLLEVEKHLSAFVSWSLTERLQHEDASKDPLLAPIAIFACQVGLAAVWRSLGIQPSCVVGQSIGEIAAAYTAGCLSLSDAVKIIYHRSELLAEVTGGAMMVVQNVEVNEVRQVLNETENKASIALEYSPRACAISADPETILSLRTKLSHLKGSHKNMRLVDLDVHVAYHSPQVNGAAEKLKKLINGVTPRVPLLPFLSTVTGHLVQDPLQSGHWADNVKKPVLFHQAMAEAVPSKTASNTVFLEVGPRPVLRAHMHDLFPDAQHKTVPSITVQSEMKCLYQSIVTLHEQGAHINWRNLPTFGNQITAVPRYFFNKKYLKGKTEKELVVYAGCNPYRKNHLFVYPTEESTDSFRLLLSPLTFPSVYQHVAMGSIVIPGALYAECGLAIARYIYTHAHVSVSVELQQLCPLKKDEPIGLQILPGDSSSTAEVREKQFVVQMEERKLASIQVTEVETELREQFNLNAVRSKCVEEVNKASIYSSLRKFGFEYGTAFSLLEHAYRNSFECLATLEVHDTVISEMSDTILHPCILDCMIQSAVLVLGDSKMTSEEMLPKSIDGLVVLKSLERVMYVHTRLKRKGSNFLLFEIKLLSAEGHVIAEVTDFTIQVLASQENKGLPDMLGVQWNKIKDISHGNHAEEMEEQKRNVLWISEKRLSDEDNIIHLLYDSSSGMDNLRKEMEPLLLTQTVEAVAFIVPKEDVINDADDTQTKVINFCLLLQSIFIALNDQQLHIPVIMCTFNAWPSPAGKEMRDVNPIATALWGLVRTAIDEHSYSGIIAVELHTASGDLNRQSLQRLFDLLLTDEDLADCPEVLITEDSIYVSQVVRLKDSSLLVPERRKNLPIRMEEISGGAVVLSKKASKKSKLFAISQEAASPSEHHMTLRAHSFALPPEKLFSTKVTSAHLFPDKMGQGTDYVVMALEVTGHVKDGSNQEVTSCGPLTVGPELPISVDTTLTTASLPHYQPGDLCKLVLFWSLVDKVPTKRFSIFASIDTKHLAELVKLLSCNATKRKDSDINIVLIENMREEVSYHETVLSLILLDVETMSVIAGGWKNTHSLVSLTCLVTKDLQAYVACMLPDTHLSLLDSQLLFQLQQLKSIIPNLKEWMRKNTGLMSSVCQHLHVADKAEHGEGIHGLLHFHSLNLSTLSVQLVSDKLFCKDGAYLVVGGLTGLGWLCVEFLAQNNAGYIVILNRRAASPEQITNMNNLAHQHGCRIKSFKGDVSSMKSLQEILQVLTSEWSEEGCLRGIFIGAAVLQDGLFLAMERSAFENALTPKVKGTWNLHMLTKDLSLDYFVMHSSVASVLGNLGQANYSTGNAFLDGLAFHRRYLGLASQTINWGPLDTGLLDNQDTLKERLDSMGFHLSRKQEIMEMIPVLLLLNWTQSIPVSLNLELYANRIRGTALPSLMKRFEHLLSGAKEGKSNLQMPGMEGVGKIRFQSPPQRLEAYENFVRELATRILSVDIALVTREVSFYDLGLDSVTGMMMVSVIERSTSFKLSTVSVLTGEVTVASLAQLLDSLASEASQ